MSLLKNNLFTWVILGLIFILALFIRVYSLSSIPNGFHIDEASLGYNGYSLLLTGKDENNHKLPFYIDMFGDNRPSGYHYLTAPAIKIFGLNEFATRIPGALFGALSIIPFFFLAKVLFKNKKISLLSAFLLSISPWSVVLSRAGNETVVALFCIITGYLVFLGGFQKKKILYLVIGAIIISLSFFFYHTPRVFVPMLVLASVIYLYPLWKKFNLTTKVSLIFSFFLISFIAFLLVIVAKGGTGRFSQVNIFGYPEVKLVMEEQIREDGGIGMPILATRAFHNKLVNYSLGFATNYFDYFSGKFLFIEGGLPNWYKVPGMGLIYLVELPFILMGIFYLLSSREKYHKLPLLWLLIAPVTAAFTVDDVPNVNRAIVMFPMIELAAAYGFVTITERFSGVKLKTILIISSLFLFANFSYFLHQYFIHAPTHQNWYRYEGFSQMIDVVKKDYSSSNKIVVSKSFGGIYPLVLFYMKYDPATYQDEGSPKDKSDGGFGKFFFTSSACPSVDRDPKVPKVSNIVFIDNGTCPSYKTLKNHKYLYIYRKDGTKAFRIVYE
jgi:4-amino-4-deoxy-L-arabinose transferase-like glycosyltransferase